ncbi:MAG: histidinol-phosphatase [Alistipes sp.]|nr:histidinol-phosphatase [Alistipes sp.]
MKNALLSSLLTFVVMAVSAQNFVAPQMGKMAIRLFDNTAKRTEIVLPQVKGYTLYKADFHVHTIYSDGDVTPRERVMEAWYDGLDIVAITDHLEKRTYEKFMLKALAPYSKDGSPFVYAHAGAGNKTNQDAPMLSNMNATVNEAIDWAEQKGYPIMVVRGSEIWREPSTIGEYNALFLKDVNAICDKDLFECFRRVKEQGGIIIHNHPGWRRPTMEKSEEQQRIYAEGWVDGIEVVNEAYLYPQMLRRCKEEKLFIAANTDTHHPTAQRWPQGCGMFRTMTFILAKEKSEKAIKEALLDRRTIGYCANNLIGEQRWLQEFFDAAVECRIIGEDAKAKADVYMLTNTCSVPFALRVGNAVQMLKPFQSLRLTVSKKRAKPLTFVVENMWIVDEQHPKLTLRMDK